MMNGPTYGARCEQRLATQLSADGAGRAEAAESGSKHLLVQMRASRDAVRAEPTGEDA